jgi:hypothetical protein
MSETEPATAAEDKTFSPLEIFFAKVATVTVAILIVLYALSYYLDAFMENQQENLRILKGGPAFWGSLEAKLYKLADEPDLPPEKKKKIVDALRKLSSKYKPYLDAIGGDASPGEPKNR